MSLNLSIERLNMLGAQIRPWVLNYNMDHIDHNGILKKNKLW